MKTERNILIAFILNLAFAVFEAVGGVIIGSVAILSDALHDLGDAMSIGISFFLERKSKKQADTAYTYGYGRYSVLGGVITTLILLLGSVVVIWHAVQRLLSPVEINYDGMIIFALVGAGVNLLAAYVTREGDSINQKAVNLHMLEDVLGWIVVLIGAVVMRFTDFAFIDPLLSICVAAFIVIHAAKTLKEALGIFLEKTPEGIDMEHVKAHICQIAGVCDVHHIHIWSMDGRSHYATLHIKTDGSAPKIKEEVRNILQEHGVIHATLELEAADEPCSHELCRRPQHHESHHHHHHHHH